MRAPQWTDLPTEAFGRWAVGMRLVLPVPLNSGYAARVTVSDDELVAITDDRIDVANSIVPDRGAMTAGLAPDVGAVLVAVESVLRDPEWGLYAGHVDAEGTETLVVGLAQGTQAVIVRDTAEAVQVAPCAAADVSSALIDLLPVSSPARVNPVELGAAQLAAVGGPGGLSPTGRLHARSAGLDARTLEVLKQADRSPVRGMIGAVRYVSEGAEPSQHCAEWFETASGGLLKRTLRDGRVRLEPATPTALRRVAVGGAESVRRAG